MGYDKRCANGSMRSLSPRLFNQGSVVDRDRMAQAKTGDRIRFDAVDVDTAIAARRDRARRIQEVRDTVAGGAATVR